MNCSSYNLLISRYIDDSLDEELRTELELHLGICPACRLTLARYRRLDNRLRQMPAIGAPSSCRQKLFRSVEAERQWFPMPIWRLPRALATASLLLVCLLLGGFLLPMVDQAGITRQLSAIWSPGATYNTSTVSSSSPDALGASVAEAEDRVRALTGYLPPAASVEQVALHWDEAAEAPAYVQIVFMAPPGTMVRLERRLIDSSTDTAAVPYSDKAILVRGQVWRCASSTSPDGGEMLRLVHNSDGGNLTSLEGRAPLQNLVEMVEWLR